VDILIAARRANLLVTFPRRQLRLRVLEALERRAKAFRGYEGVWPFRIPHEPLALDAVIEYALSDDVERIGVQDLQPRMVLRMEWTDSGHAWGAWTIALPSGILMYCDDDGDEARVLASVRRGNAVEADGFFLELLAETHGHAFGIEMAGGVPDRIRTSIADREFLTDVFVDLFEDTDAERDLREMSAAPQGDFRAHVEAWLASALATQPPARSPRRQPRRREQERFGG
jgi:hypothetical protein